MRSYNEMAAFAHDDGAVEAELRATTEALFASDERDALTVNMVRRRVETKLGIGAGDLETGSWKGRSKAIIKARVVCVGWFRWGG